MEKFHELYFEEDEIPARMREGLRDLELISGSETHCRRYILLLARTCDVRTVCCLCGQGRQLDFCILCLCRKDVSKG